MNTNKDVIEEINTGIWTPDAPSKEFEVDYYRNKL